jgi:hypothetical protein
MGREQDADEDLFAVHLAEFPDLDMNMMRAHFLLQFQPEFFVF